MSSSSRREILSHLVTGVLSFAAGVGVVFADRFVNDEDRNLEMEIVVPDDVRGVTSSEAIGFNVTVKNIGDLTEENVIGVIDVYGSTEAKIKSHFARAQPYSLEYLIRTSQHDYFENDYWQHVQFSMPRLNPGDKATIYVSVSTPKLIIIDASCQTNTLSKSTEWTNKSD